MTIASPNSKNHTPRIASGEETVRRVTMSSEDMWKRKRDGQRADIEGIQSGTVSVTDMNWFAGGVARNAKVIGTLV